MLSALPLISAGNCCCCMWVIAGGAVAAYLLQQHQAAPITRGRRRSRRRAGGADWRRRASRGFDSRAARRRAHPDADDAAHHGARGGREPRVRSDGRSDEDGAAHGIFALIIGFAFFLVIGTVFATVGGMLGALFFKKDQPPVARRRRRCRRSIRRRSTRCRGSRGVRARFAGGAAFGGGPLGRFAAGATESARRSRFA